MKSVLKRRGCTVLLATTLVYPWLRAQDSATTAIKKADNEEPVALSTFVVTGSNIPTAADAAAMPVTILGQQEIQRTGLNANLLEILRKDMPLVIGRSSVGDSNANNTNQVTAGGSQIALRNLDTLVLVNGRRLATSSVNAIGGKNFVDLNQIPAAAIERIEVLAGGASAIYGSDAIGGVVNIILKSNFHGEEIGGRYAVATSSGHYSERSAYLVAGAAAHGISLTVTGSWSKTDPLFQKDRPFSHPFTGKTSTYPGVAGGALLNPSLSTPSQTNGTGASATAPNLAALIANGTYWAATDSRLVPGGLANQFDASPFQTMLVRQDQRGISANGSAALIGKKLVFFGDVLATQTKGFNQTYVARNDLVSVTVPAGSPYNPLTTAFTGVVFGYLPAPLQFFNNAKSNRATAGFRGELTPNWNWETGYTYHENRLVQQFQNLPYLPNLTRAIAGGYNSAGVATPGGAFSRVLTGFSESSTNFVIQPAINPFARTAALDPASLANVLGAELVHTKSSIESYDFKVVGTPVSLPAGKLGLAAGASTRRDWLAGNPDENSYNTGPTNHRWGGSGTYFDPFGHGRTVTGYFAEVRAPVAGPDWHVRGVHALDLSLAARQEHYSDSGDSRVPKLGLRWQPVDDQVTLRFNYSKAYTAPTLYAMFGPSITSKSGPTVISTALGNPAFNGLVLNSLSDSNPDLKPTQSWSRSLGAVISPKALKGFTLTIDYVNVYQKGFFSTVGSTNFLQSVDKLGPTSPFIGNLAFNNYPGYPGAVPISSAGQISRYLSGGGDPLNLYARDHMINLSGVHVEAFDVQLDYERTTANAGKFGAHSTAAIFTGYHFEALPIQPYYQYAGYATNGGTGQQGTLPKFHLYSTLDWSLRNWRVAVSSTYIPAVSDVGAGGDVYANSTILKTVPVDRYITWDLLAGYTFREKNAGGWFGVLSGMKFNVGVNNLFNRMPPLAPQAFVDNNADVAAYSPIGRLLFVSTSLKF